MTAKTELRVQLKQELRSHSKSDLSAKSFSISENAIRLIRDAIQQQKLGKDAIFGVYAPLKDEVELDLSSEFDQCLAYPTWDELSFAMDYKLSRKCELVVSKEFGVAIQVPNVDAPKVTPDLLFVPGLGFSRSGQRLGRGGGFYDKFLSSFRGIRVGVCFQGQLIENIPTSSHDETVHFVITENEIICCNT